MKALSLRQPWANAVLDLGKTIENRTWNTNYRGDFLIHASQKMTNAYAREVWAICETVVGNAAAIGKAFTTVPIGGIVGIATLVDVIRPRPADVDPRLYYGADVFESEAWRWHFPEQFGFVLANVRRTPFVKHPGALSFFKVPEHIEAAALAPVEITR